MERLDRLTTLRFWMALLVVFFHCQLLLPAFKLTTWTGMATKGYLAVDFFFILSGFILALGYAKQFDQGRGEYVRFIAYRFGRIYPVHLLTLLLQAALVAVGLAVTSSPLVRSNGSTLSLNLVMMHAWGIVPYLSWNVPSWSISAEWFAYLIFPAVLAVSRKVGQRCWVALIGASACVATLTALTSLLLSGVRLGDLEIKARGSYASPFDITADFGLLRVTLEFLAGVLLFRAFSAMMALPRRHRWAAYGSPAIVALLVITLHATWGERALWQDATAVMLAAALILTVAADSSSWFSRLLSRPLGVHLGEISFALYMVQSPVIAAYRGLVRSSYIQDAGSLGAATLVVCALIAIALALASLIFLYVETPARFAVRTAFERRTAGRAGKTERVIVGA